MTETAKAPGYAARGQRPVSLVLSAVLVVELVAWIPQYRCGNLALLVRFAAGRSAWGTTLWKAARPEGSGSDEILSVGGRYGPWKTRDTRGTDRSVPSPGRMTGVIAVGGCTSCSSGRLGRWAYLAGKYPDVVWYCLAPDAIQWAMSQDVSARECLVFVESDGYVLHKAMGASFTPRVYLFDADGVLLYRQPPEASPTEAADVIDRLLAAVPHTKDGEGVQE